MKKTTNMGSPSISSMQQAYAQVAFGTLDLSQLSQQGLSVQTPFPFKIGDQVRIKSDSRYYVGQHDLTGDGVIREIEDPAVDQPHIRFSNGYLNAYFASDLELVPTKEKKPRVTLDSVILSNEKKEEIRAAISQIKHEETIFNTWGFSEVFEKGTAISLIFWGIPGTGKTLTAQAIADELNMDLKTYGVAEIQSSEPGGAERQIQSIFASASRTNRDVNARHEIILFDECDTLLMDRNEVGPIMGAMVNQLLVEIEHYVGIIIFTTNRLGKLDPALERRISAKIEFEFPDEQARYAIWKRMMPKKAPLARNVNIKELAEHALAGGNIKNAVLNAARRAAYEQADKISHKHFTQAIQQERRALDAFISEYEDQPHSRLVNQIRYNERGGLSVDSKMKATITRGDNE